jgi:hypothetical protein
VGLGPVVGLGLAARVVPALDGRPEDRVALGVEIPADPVSAGGRMAAVLGVAAELGVGGLALVACTAPSRLTPSTPPTSTAATTPAVATGPRDDLRVRPAACLPVKTDPSLDDRSGADRSEGGTSDVKAIEVLRGGL